VLYSILLMKIARGIKRLIESFERLPGIGPKTAQRLTYYLLHVPQGQLEEFGEALSSLKRKTKTCSICFNVAEVDPCPICTDRSRDQSRICIVEQPLDVLAIEKSGVYNGLYHVLHGSISPLDNIGPDEIHIHDLSPRLEDGKISELIIATNPTMEGEATAMYIANLVGKQTRSNKLQVTRLGRGLPTGADLEYADEITLTKAFEGRRKY